MIEEIGPVGGKLHTGRSRNDQVATDMHLYLRKRVVEFVGLLIKLQEALLEQAKDNLDTIIPGYTHLQRAQPISVRPSSDGLCLACSSAISSGLQDSYKRDQHAAARRWRAGRHDVPDRPPFCRGAARVRPRVREQPGRSQRPRFHPGVPRQRVAHHDASVSLLRGTGALVEHRVRFHRTR